MTAFLREVAKLLAPHKDGMSTEEIAARLNLPTVEALRKLKELEKDAVVYSEGNNKGGRLIWFLDKHVSDMQLVSRFHAKERKCLGCKKMFMSAHAGNRFCDVCRPPDDDGKVDESDIENLTWKMRNGQRNNLKDVNNNDPYYPDEWDWDF